MMDILAPLNDIGYLDALAQAGVTEMYFGFWDEKWYQNFGALSCINRMSNFEKEANSFSFAEALETVKRVQDAGIKAYITLNAAHYSSEGYEFVMAYLDRLAEQKPDGVIVSCQELVAPLLERGLEPVASTMCGVFNADIAGFYKALGVRRMIFPREVTTLEMAEICRAHPQVVFEAFCMRNGCMLSDAFCLGIHSREHGSLCRALCRSDSHIVADRKDFASVHRVEETSLLLHERYHQGTCGLCALYRLEQLGIRSLKIVGRADHPQAIVRDAGLIRQNLQIAQKCRTEEEYLSRMQFPHDRLHRCKNGMSCYYPELRF